MFLLHSDCPGAKNNKKEFIQLLVTYFHEHTITCMFHYCYGIVRIIIDAHFWFS